MDREKKSRPEKAPPHKNPIPTIRNDDRRSLQLQIRNLARQKWFGNLFWLYALQGLNYLVPLAVLPYLLRILGVEHYGLIAFAQAFAQYFIILTDYGFNLSATKRIALLRDDRRQVSIVFWSVLVI